MVSTRCVLVQSFALFCPSLIVCSSAISLTGGLTLWIHVLQPIANLVMGNSCCSCWQFYCGSKGAKQRIGNSEITLDPLHLGEEGVIVKQGLRLCGSGGALATAPLTQSKTYFEVTIQTQGHWGIGLATRQADLNYVPLGLCEYSWMMLSDGRLLHRNTSVALAAADFDEGDVIGVSFDHVELKFFLNGSLLDGASFSGLRGTLYPCLFVDQGAILDLELVNFIHDSPTGFLPLMVEQDLSLGDHEDDSLKALLI
eukprot:m.83149 g.83149  ORF g.83149 m.83149 type:complete len:255 (+) comp12714_c1_seq4:93-857(+)